ncbi:39S ribosomal mitochondrial [Micractinium conductrix]|uniref:Large ribosomal subunit protein uL4m n=1 Tax=Micractinium conductrix TaxID=554055 RepID=A0A2P6VFC1_9CHLO|nr:39S ribosomal mitochondrial [Micractinium conductrix]|eukprot:PSC72778.1 39S ribosomal mitochondrial [Micractinium conductrix]
MSLRTLSVLRRAAASLPSQTTAAGSLLEALQLPQQQLSGGSAAGLAGLLAAARRLGGGASMHTSPAAAAAAAEEAAEQEVDLDSWLPAIPIEQQAEQGLYRDLTVPVLNLRAEPVGSYTLPGDLFDVPIRRDILQRVVRWQLAKRQQGTHKTLGRSEVRGGGRKPRPQKGSGQSRQGTIRAPQWRGGGVVHGPVQRSHEHSLPKRVRRLGLQCALSAKAWERRLLVVDSLAPVDARTRTMSDHVAALLADAPRRSVLLCDSSKEGEDGGEVLRRAAANLPWVDAIPQLGLNVYSILQRDYLVLTQRAADLLTERMRQPIKPCSPTP